jgi:hypothetical protein
MNKTASSIDKYHNTPRGKLLFAAAELAIAYAAFWWATDSGSWLAYGLTILFFVGGLRNLIDGFRHVKKPAKK